MDKPYMHTNINEISSLQNELNHPIRSTDFYFKRKVGKLSWNAKMFVFFSFRTVFLKIFIFEVVKVDLT